MLVWSFGSLWWYWRYNKPYIIIQKKELISFFNIKRLDAIEIVRCNCHIIFHFTYLDCKQVVFLGIIVLSIPADQLRLLINMIQIHCGRKCVNSGISIVYLPPLPRYRRNPKKTCGATRISFFNLKNL